MQLKKWLGILTPPMIMGYRGYGTRRQVYISGHVLDDRMLFEAEAHHRKRKNIMAMISRYMSHELKDVRVQIDFGGQQKVVITDRHGYFGARFEFNPPLTNTGWLPVKYTALDRFEDVEASPVQNGEVYVLEEEAAYGVISDVDDTILVSHATNALKKLRIMLTKNAKTRLPFTGVASFYHALKEGRNGRPDNPLFFISSSEYNLYDFLVDFCEARDIPKGVFMLQEYKTSVLKFLRSGGGTHEHKAEKIAHLMEIYPKLNFILIGDSGQRDPEIYRTISEKYPGRILAIYIRDVKGRKKDSKTIRPGKDEKIPLFFIENTGDAADHALDKGFINRAQWLAVHEDLSFRP